MRDTGEAMTSLPSIEKVTTHQGENDFDLRLNLMFENQPSSHTVNMKTDNLIMIIRCLFLGYDENYLKKITLAP